MMMDTAHFLAECAVEGLKIHLLYVVKETPLAALYQRGEYHCLERDEYIELVVDFLERLPPTMIIHRLTGDPISSELMAPLWAKNKSQNLSLIRKRLEERDTWQGKKCQISTVGKYTRMT